LSETLAVALDTALVSESDEPAAEETDEVVGAVLEAVVTTVSEMVPHPDPFDLRGIPSPPLETSDEDSVVTTRAATPRAAAGEGEGPVVTLIAESSDVESSDETVVPESAAEEEMTVDERPSSTEYVV
jgi:hypothetical protein